MKILIKIVSIAILAQAFYFNAQVINWENINQNNIASLNFGTEYGMVAGLGYGHKMSNGKFPYFLNTEISIPFGEKSVDDFKFKIGGQMRLYQFNNFNIIAKLQGIYRVYHNDFVKISNFGSDFSTTFGYYKRNWFTAIELGFDKAIVSHYKHSDLYKSNFEGVKDGWYEPSTGGNFYGNLKFGYSFGKNDITISGGRIITQNFKTSPLFPIYSQISFNRKF